MRSKRRCKTGAIQLRTTATRTIKRHDVNRTVNRQSSGAILAELKHRLSEIYDLTAAGSVLTWDEATYMPKGGTVARGRQSSLLRRLAHERFVDPALGRLIDRLEPGTDKLPADDASLIRIVRRDYERAIRVPAEYVARANAHGSASYNAWIWARPANDFAAMIPFLEKTLDLRREYASFFAPYDHIADPMIDDADEGMTTATIQRLFAELRRELFPMVRAICDQPPADDGCLRRSFGEEAQLGFGLSVATQMGYDLERGRLDQTHHPFCTKFAAGDVRITTRVRENHIGDALFSTLHEAGHAMYEQGVNAAYEGTPLGSGVSLGVHESQSRLWENVVARSRPFWEHYYPALQRTFAHQLGSVPVDIFYRAINKVEPSLIRTDADEVTYNLHIMLRFELELKLLEGRLRVKDLPEAWFGAARARSPRINSNKAACILPGASVPTWVRCAIRICIRSLSETARSTSPRGHDTSRQIGHRRDAGVPCEAKGQIVIAAGLEQGERPFEVIPRLAILAGEPAGDPGGSDGRRRPRANRGSPRRR